MKHKVINITIAVNALALLGVIVTQLFWVDNALELKREQVNQNVQLGLKRVVNQLMSLQNDTAFIDRFYDPDSAGSIHRAFIHSIDHALIDSMIAGEFNSLNISESFYYGIFRKDRPEFVLINDTLAAGLILNSALKEPISCIFQEDQFVLGVFFPGKTGFVISRMQVYILLSALFMLVIVASFWFIVYILLQQKKLSHIKNDFVNNMTHELKTPISTISVATEMLMKDNVAGDQKKTRRYAQIIFDENTRLRNQVEQVLQVARLERNDFKLNLEKTDVHQVLEEVIGRFELTVSQRDGKLIKRFNAAKTLLVADKNHLAGVFYNLLDNANKYSLEKPIITVSTISNRRGIKIVIEDQGIGMAEDQLSQIFKKFQRIPTGDLHNVKGFGIGLYYVKNIVEAHGGSIKVTSKPGKGSTFSLFFNHVKFEENPVVKEPDSSALNKTPDT